MAEIKLPDWVTDLKPLTDVAGFLASFGDDPAGWLRKHLVRFLLGAIAGLVLDIAGIIRDGWTAVNGALRGAAETSRDAMSLVGDVALEPLAMVNQQLFNLVLGSTFGPFEAPIIVSLYALELALVVRLAKPALLALGELSSGIPVVGGVINSGVTGLVRASDALFGFGRQMVAGVM